MCLLGTEGFGVVRGLRNRVGEVAFGGGKQERVLYVFESGV